MITKEVSDGTKVVTVNVLNGLLADIKELPVLGVAPDGVRALISKAEVLEIVRAWIKHSSGRA